MSCEIDFEPIGRRVRLERGETLLEAAQRAGVLLTAVCGGEGVCGRCLIRVLSGEVSPPNLTEQADLDTEELASGWRLACQVELQGDVRVHVPPESLVTAQRTQTEGYSLAIPIHPGVQVQPVELPQPTLEDLRSDASRIRDALGEPELNFNLPVLQSLSEQLRRSEFRASVFRRGVQVIAVRPPGSRALGLAVDLGTTKLAAYLVDLSSGETLASAGAMNPQIAYGEDILARIGYTLDHEDGNVILREAVVEALNELIARLCDQSGCVNLDIADAVVVGNTAMHHLFSGLPVKQLGLAPYVAAESAAVDIPTREIGLEIAPGASVHLLPNIAGFVGADHVAMLLATGLLDRRGVVLGMDIGTNTEISLVAHGRHYTCSAASGPAFEGAHILHGMRAAPGAIEKVLIRDEQVFLQTVDNAPPVGICGSGILDVVAQLRRAGILTVRGGMTLDGGNSRIRGGGHGIEYILVPADENGGKEITFSRSDVSEIQLAKGAIRAGVNTLLQHAGLAENEIDRVIIAGAFGTYLDVQSGIDIGMFPRLPLSRFEQVGNAAGAGARMALLSTAQRGRAIQIAAQARYIELTVQKSFSSTFARALVLE